MDEYTSEYDQPSSLRPRPTSTGYEPLKFNWEMQDNHKANSEHQTRISQRITQATADRIEERRYRRRWLPWLFLTFALNFFFWISMLYAIFEIEKYHEHRHRFLATAWLIFVVPSAFVMLLLFSPYPTTFKRWRNGWSERKTPRKYFAIVNILNALACLVIVIVYLYVSAIPAYNRPKWETSIEFQPYLPVPSFAFIFWTESTSSLGRNDVQPANTKQLGDQDLECFSANYTGNAGTNGCNDAMEWRTIGGYKAHLFNSSKLPAVNSTISNLQSQVWLTTYINYNSTTAKNNDGLTPSSMDLGVVFFDPRMDLDTVWNCGLVGFPTFPAFATNYISLTASYTSDKYGLLRPQGNISPDCRMSSKSLFGMTDSSYTSWSFTLDSSLPNPDLASCDVVKNGKDAICESQVVIGYSTQMVQRVTSSPGLSKLDIWLNAGAIVGGVQFFVWFLGTFAQI